MLSLIVTAFWYLNCLRTVRQSVNIFVERNSDKVRLQMGRDTVNLVLSYQLMVCTLLIFYPIYGVITLSIVPISIVLKYVFAWRSPLNWSMLGSDIILAVLVGLVYEGTQSGFHYTPIITAIAFIWARMRCDFMLPSKMRLKISYQFEEAGMASVPYIVAAFNCIIAASWAVIAVW